MLDIKLLRQSIETVKEALAKRGLTLDVLRFTALEEQRKALQVKAQALQETRNKRSKEIGQQKAQGQSLDASATADLKNINSELKAIEEQFAIVENELNQFLAVLPNLPHASVPLGESEADNQVVRMVGEPRHFSFTPKAHALLGERYGMDFTTATKLSGARYVVLKGPLARLQRSLIQFMLDLHTREHGYQEIYVPAIANEVCLFGTGQLPKFKEDLFALLGTDSPQYLVPTSEVTVTNTVREQILPHSALPIKYACYSSCFRSEAGSYGKDVHGMFRQHQFEKVELVQIVHPDTSYNVLEALTGHAEAVLQRLELPYRVVALSTGDLGFAAAKTYDLEVWLPGQNCYREISSCSNTEAFQARRMKARFKEAGGQIDWVHTLNGSGLAVGRTLIAVLENYQDEAGCVRIPSVLQPYMQCEMLPVL